MEITENDVKNSISLSSRNSINEIAQLISSSCKCDCDISSTGIVESTTTLSSTLQNEAELDVNSIDAKSKGNPVVFVITPTYTRATQLADLTRLAQTLMLVKDVFWIVVEDANTKSL